MRGWMVIAAIGLAVNAAAACAQESPVVLPDKAGDFKYGIYHAGLRVKDIDEMVDFLTRHSTLKTVSRVQLPNGGERLFLSDARGQRLELLSIPGSVPVSDAPARQRNAATGAAHIAIEVEDAASLKPVLLDAGYELIWQAPGDFADGYVVSEVDAHRVLYIEGPSGVFFEFFEIKK